jgi:predicted metal-dependent phosphotriesterase family hydrolase
MEMLRDHGAHLPGCFFSHPEWKPGWEGRDRREQALYLQEITEVGGGIQLNNFGLDFDTPYEDLLFLIEELESAGFGGQIFLSTDCNWQFDEDGVIWHYGEREHPGMDRRAFDYLLQTSVPRLLRSGVSPRRIQRYLVDNPRRLFEAAAESGSAG